MSFLDVISLITFLCRSVGDKLSRHIDWKLFKGLKPLRVNKNDSLDDNNGDDDRRLPPHIFVIGPLVEINCGKKHVVLVPQKIFFALPSILLLLLLALLQSFRFFFSVIIKGGTTVCRCSFSVGDAKLFFTFREAPLLISKIFSILLCAFSFYSCSHDSGSFLSSCSSESKKLSAFLFATRCALQHFETVTEEEESERREKETRGRRL